MLGTRLVKSTTEDGNYGLGDQKLRWSGYKTTSRALAAILIT
ncbi:hypothetical protein JCM19232_223 [Vibrio ishigakensis]|uniref:Uncharacterized protein n=1 Tax=Vibrio ishigakensis TaxID=1481914 RepID=A0A0B8NZC9_9VIBR|nr:hypothetical protein JCM19232_223 [Vibrio ishigakensis]